MKLLLLPSSGFLKASKKLIRKKPDLQDDIKNALQLLGEDAFNPALKTHKLAGVLAGSWACSAGYDVRIVFSFAKHEGKQAILLENIGTHEEVY